MAKKRKDLEQYEEMIVEALARFASLGEICIMLSEHGVHVEASDIAPYREGKEVEEVRRKIVADLPIRSTAFCLMELDKMIRGEASSAAEKLSAIRIRTALVKKQGQEMSPDELMGDDE